MIIVDKFVYLLYNRTTIQNKPENTFIYETQYHHYGYDFVRGDACRSFAQRSSKESISKQGNKNVIKELRIGQSPDYQATDYRVAGFIQHLQLRNRWH